MNLTVDKTRWRERVQKIVMENYVEYNSEIQENGKKWLKIMKVKSSH